MQGEPRRPARRPGLARPWERPDAEFGAVVPVSTMPFDTDGPTAVAITGVLAYSNGFEFFYSRIVRPGQREVPRAPNPSGHLLTREAGFRLGVAFAGGPQAFPADLIQPRYPDEPGQPFLFPGLGSTGGYRQDGRWWVWPLPPPGKLTFICLLGGTEAQVSMNAQLILDASQRTIQV